MSQTYRITAVSTPTGHVPSIRLVMAQTAAGEALSDDEYERWSERRDALIGRVARTSGCHPSSVLILTRAAVY